MGGRRCFFRNCAVTTSRNPGIHFFRFPKRNLDEWLKFTGCDNFYNLTELQRRNMVICGRHFRDECFMNYKQDRLTPTAVPTLTRLNKEWAIDYEQEELIKLSTPKQQHLIAPSGFEDPQAFNEEDLKLALETISDDSKIKAKFEPQEKRRKLDEQSHLYESTQVELIELITEHDMVDNSIDVVENEQQRTLPEECIAKNEQVLKERVRELERLLAQKTNELNELASKLEDCEEELGKARQENASLSKGLKNFYIQTKNHAKEKQELKTVLQDAVAEAERYKSKYHNFKGQYDALLVESETNLELKTQLCNSNDENKSLKNEYLSLKDKNCFTNDETTATATVATTAQFQKLTKLQLFNGMKRYLSQPMTALVRMQLAAISTERNWKPDEKRVATDLLSLGQEVYKYFIEEWRIRLPTMEAALKWQSENHHLVDYEDEL